MKPLMPNNAYELSQMQKETKMWLERLEKAEPDEQGIYTLDKSVMDILKGKLRDSIDLIDCLLYLMIGRWEK